MLAFIICLFACAPVTDATGIWAVRMDLGGATVDATMMLVQIDTQVAGHLQWDDQTFPIAGTATSNEVHLDVDGSKMNLVIVGDYLSGPTQYGSLQGWRDTMPIAHPSKNADWNTDDDDTFAACLKSALGRTCNYLFRL